jgi:uncharacterized SAM-binding protein YcdF (DUF218 family)
MFMHTEEKLAQTLWDYLRLGQRPQRSDVILCLGNEDIRTALRAAELYQQGLAPKVLFTGGIGHLTPFQRPEAEMFAAAARSAGVPTSDILLETRSTSTGENIVLSYKLLHERGLEARSILVVTKPYMERRVMATLQAQWPEPRPGFSVTSPQVSFEKYCKDIPMHQVIGLMVGYVQRIREYPKLGLSDQAADSG